MAVVEFKSQSRYRKDMNTENCYYAETGNATFVIVHRKEKRGREKGKLILGLAEPFNGHDLNDMIKSGRKSTKPRECQQKERKTCAHSFYCRRVFRSSEEVNGAVLREMDLTAWELLGYKALN